MTVDMAATAAARHVPREPSQRMLAPAIEGLGRLTTGQYFQPLILSHAFLLPQKIRRFALKVAPVGHDPSVKPDEQFKGLEEKMRRIMLVTGFTLLLAGAAQAQTATDRALADNAAQASPPVIQVATMTENEAGMDTVPVQADGPPMVLNHKLQAWKATQPARKIPPAARLKIVAAQ